MRRAVLDLNVLVSALIAPSSASATVLGAWLNGHFELAISEEMLHDLAGVLGRPRLSSRVTEEEVVQLMALIRAHAVVVPEPADFDALTGDPEDDRSVAVARAAGAELIVSGDRHLLDQVEPRAPVLKPRDFVTSLA